MATRSGDVDPTIPLYLQQHCGLSAADVDKLLNKQSGFQGLCGLTDLRGITTAGTPEAQMALQVKRCSAQQSLYSSQAQPLKSGICTISISCVAPSRSCTHSQSRRARCQCQQTALNCNVSQEWCWMSRLSEGGQPHAQVFVHRLRKYLGSYLLQLADLDDVAIIFSGGIGENSPLVRSMALQGLEVRAVRAPMGCMVRAKLPIMYLKRLIPSHTAVGTLSRGALFEWSGTFPPLTDVCVFPCVTAMGYCHRRGEE